MTVERQPDRRGGRVKIGISGSFRSYQTYWILGLPADFP